MAQARTLYEVLGAHPEATLPQIKKAYREAARKWHPDKAHPADKKLAEATFKKIAEAYEVIGDKQLRQLYDVYLQCRDAGHVEVRDPDPNAPYGSYIQVPFGSWEEFRGYFGGGLEPGRRASSGTYNDMDDPDATDSPISVVEWALAATAAIGLWMIFSSYHRRREWLKALPQSIWRVHVEYAQPMGLLLSPLFFGNVPFMQAMEWLKQAVDTVDLD